MLLRCNSSRGNTDASLGSSRKIIAADATFRGHLEIQTTAKGHADKSPQSGGCDCPQGTMSMSAVMKVIIVLFASAAFPGPVEAPATRLTIARIASRRESIEENDMQREDRTELMQLKDASALPEYSGGSCPSSTKGELILLPRPIAGQKMSNGQTARAAPPKLMRLAWLPDHGSCTSWEFTPRGFGPAKLALSAPAF